MSFNKNNPNAMGKIMGYLKQLSTEMGGSEQNRRGASDEERLYRQRGPKYARVPSRPTLSASTTCTSLATSCGSQGTLAPNYACIPEHVSTESSSEDEQETFEKTRRHFQQLRQISLGNEFKYKMEMEIKSAKDENLRNAVPYVTQLSSDNVKVKVDGSINGDGKPYKPTTQRIFLLTQLFSALAVAMGSLVIGFASSYTSSALTNMNQTLTYNVEQKSWIGGILPLAALIGGVAGGPLIEYLGRKRTIISTAVPFFVGWMLIATANQVLMVLAGRAFCGFCVGVLSLASPVYLGETVQPEVRGILGLLPTAFGNIGILLGFLAGTYLNWSQLAYLGAALPLPFFILMFFTPETPRWYVTKGRHEDALKSLQWLRGKNINVEKEMRDLTLTQTESDKSGSGVGQIFSRKYLPAVLISLGLMLFQQFSGINAVVFYATEIFQKSGSTVDENLSSIIIGIVNFISTFLATAIIDKLGRKILLYISAVLMIITLVILGAYLYVQSAQVASVSTYGWIPLACLVIYVLGFSIGFGPIPWLMVGEILPSKIRSSAASIVTGFNWSCTFLVTKTFQNIVIGINLYGAIWLFAMFCLAALFFVIFFVPETKGRSLEDIEKRLTGGMRRVRSSTKQPQNGC